MKKYLIFLAVMLAGNSVHGYSQSADYSRYYNQMMQKAKNLGTNLGNEINRELERCSRLAMNPSNKDIFVLYAGGNKLGSFADEWSCKAHINSIKLQIKSAMEGLLNEAPSDVKRMYGNQYRNAIGSYINSISFTYRKESNPNYRPPNANGLNTNNIQNLNQQNPNVPNEPPKSFFSTTEPKAKDNNSNNILESLVVSDDKSDAPISIEDMLTVKSESSNQKDILNELQQGINRNNYDENRKNQRSITISGTTVNTQQNTPAPPTLDNISLPPPKTYNNRTDNNRDKEILNDIKSNMTNDQYYSLQAYLLSETGSEPDFVENRNGAYIFKDNNTIYEVTPNKFFTSLVSVKKTNINVDGDYNYSDLNNMSANWKVGSETSLAVITKGGKIVSLKENTEVTVEGKAEDESFSRSIKGGAEASKSREISYSSGVNVNIKDGKISLSTIEAHVSGNVSIGTTAGYTASANKEVSVSLVASDFKYKKEDDGIEVDASAGLAAGATIKDNEKSIRAGGDVGVASIIGEIGYKEKDCTSLYANDPKAVVHFLKNEIKTSKEKLNKTSVPVTTTGYVMDKEKIKQDRKDELTKIETYNKLIKKIETTGSTDGVIYYPTAD